jgi:acyl-CoA synthetase (NDP forming)
MLLQSLLRPASIAVIGATPSSFIGRIALENCRNHGYAGVVTPVNGRHAQVAGFDAVASLADLDHVPDVAVVQVRTARVLNAVADAVAAGVRNFVIPGGGFTDSGEDATLLVEGLRKLQAEAGIQVVGPNCMGLVDLVTRAAPYVGTVPPHIRRGTVGVVVQSGAVAELFVNAGGRVALSTVVSSGTETTTTMADYLGFFADDPETKSVIAFVEGFSEPCEFLAAARRLAVAGKPLAVAFVGRSTTSQAGVTAHSGKLAPIARVTAAALQQAGAVIADDLDELLAFGEIFSCERLPRGNRLHVVTNSGGEGNLLADLAEDAGLVLPELSPSVVDKLTTRWPRFRARNPLDPWGADDYQVIYPAAVGLLAEEDGDMLLVSQDQQRTSGEHERTLGLHLAQYLASVHQDPKLPVLLSPTSQDPDPAIAAVCREHKIPHLRGARPALAVLGKLARRTQQLQDDAKLMAVRVPHLEDPSSLAEDDALDILAGLGVSVPERVKVVTPDEAAGCGLGAPVVVKGLARGVWHKSDLGLVKVGLTTREQVRQAAAEILDVGAASGLRLELLVAEMVRGTLEVYVGYKRDPQFGHTLVLGLGGIWTEFLDVADVHVGLADDRIAGRWIPKTRVGRLLTRARGGALDISGITAAVVAVSRIAHSYPDVVAVDINPMIVSRDRAVAVDAVIQRSAGSHHHRQEETS